MAGDDDKDKDIDEDMDADGDRKNVFATITFPVDRAVVLGGRNRVAVIKSVARVYGGGDRGRDARVRVYGRLLGEGGVPLRESRPFSADVMWPAGGPRWRDVDVTGLLRRPWRRYGAVTALELSLRRRPGAAFSLRGVDGRGDRQPALHTFLEGAPPSYDLNNNRTRLEAVRCAGDRPPRRARRDDGTKRRRGGGKRRRPSPVGQVRRTDCKPEAPAVGAGNGTAERGGAGNKCCREQMRVVFADLPGFDYIVEPKSFDAGLCRGRCSAKYNLANQHAYIQSLLWKLHNNNRGDGSGDKSSGGHRKRRSRGTSQRRNGRPPKPCCAPKKLERLEILQVDMTNPKSLILTTWEETSVVECACL